MKPWLLPSGSPCEIPFIIHDDWTPEQAMAVVEMLDELRDAIYNRYQFQLQKLHYELYGPEASSSFENINETDPPF
jgi:hypothetical protein